MRVSKSSRLTEAILCSLGLMAFSFFIHHKFPLRVIAFLALISSACVISRNLRSPSDWRIIFGAQDKKGLIALLILAGILSGTILALFYRWSLDETLLPVRFRLFAALAALIGITEEWVFRGFLQELVRSVSGWGSVLFSTVSHTGYKCCLFLSPALSGQIDLPFLVIWTFIIGLIFGAVKHHFNSLWPCLAAHALFDILVYAEFTQPPWWVF